ncbi:MAG: DUF3320 domain-containing protein [Clostridiales bacterium]|nr:DUF3320 domain-containing protein [Clostridiales bacterium]
MRKLEVSAETAKAMSLPLRLAGVPLVEWIKVTNTGDEDLWHVEVSASSSLFGRWSRQTSLKVSESQWWLVNVLADVAQLEVSKEKIESVTVLARTGGIAFGAEMIFEVLPKDSWAGELSIPEALAAHMMEGLSFPLEVLGKALENGVIVNGYADGKRGVLAQMEGLYKALGHMGIKSVPPSKDYRSGQRMMGSEELKSKREATGLDLAAIYASCLEMAGLNALIAVGRRTAAVGCWTREDSFEFPAIDCRRDVASLEKDGSIVMIDPSISQGSFADSVKAGSSLLDGDEFCFLVDVARARMSGIYHLGHWVPADRQLSIDGSKLHEWESSFALDRLISYDNRNVVKILVPDLSLLVKLLKKAEIPVLPYGHGGDPSAEARRHLLSGSALTFMEAGALRAAIAEMGQAVCLGLGTLKWLSADGKPHLAPLALIPMELAKRQNGFALITGDYEPVINEAAFRFLKSYGVAFEDIDMTDLEAGIAKVLAKANREANGRQGWEVASDAYFGNFPYQDLVLWKDFREADKGGLVSSLVDLSGWPEGEAMAETAIALALDSAQLKAVQRAGEGKSFFLNGPPGTGKTQVIAGIIANSLYQGKTVLFVSQNPQAISDCMRRLEPVGITPYCLEISGKEKNVATCLGKALLAKVPEFDGSLESKLAEAERLKGQLAGAMNALNDELTAHSGMTIYEAMTEVCETKGNFEFEGKIPKTLAELENLIQICARLEEAALKVGDVSKHPLRELENSKNNNSKEELLEALQGYLARLEELDEKSKRAKAALGIGGMDKNGYVTLEKFCKVLSGANWSQASAMDLNKLVRHSDKTREILKAGIARDKAKTAIQARFADNIFSIDPTYLKERWDNATGFLGSLERAKLGKILRGSLIDGKLTNEDAGSVIEELAEYGRLNSEVEESTQHLNMLFGRISSSPDWEAYISQIDAAIQLSLIATELVGKSLGRGLLDNASVIIKSGGSESARKLVGYGFGALSGESAKLSGLLGFDPANTQEKWLESGLEKVRQILGAMNGFDDYQTYLLAKEEASENGLDWALRSLGPGFARSVRRGALQKMIDRAFEEHHMLTGFSDAFLEKAEELERVQEEATRLAGKEIRAKLASDVAYASETFREEAAMLRSAVDAGTGEISIRKLFSSIPNMLKFLSPCVALSPLSVASCFEPSHPPFDLVIIDEASQMPASLAVGAIARGKALVVAGDPKQMKPGGADSLLDMCQVASLPEICLDRHYRSRHESLVAFSNKEYYGSSIKTFPAMANIGRVKLAKLSGTYDFRETKQNWAEADAVVSEIVRRLSNDRMKNDSIGVVAFGEEQKNLINELLKKAFATKPQLAEANRLSKEPVAVRTLKEAQGLARDAVFISVAIGRGANKKMPLNAGPISGEDGWRMLNVALTRARKELVVFTVMSSTDIKFGKRGLDGLANLKAFLEYAEELENDKSVKSVESEKAVESEKSLESEKSETQAYNPEIAKTLASSLEAKGFKVQLGAGNSQAQIDLAVLMPGKTDVYALGVIICGKEYNWDQGEQTKAALKAVGWRLSYVWAVDWLRDPDRELKRLEKKIAEAIEEERWQPSSGPADLGMTWAASIEKIDYRKAALPADPGTANQFANPKSRPKITAQLKEILEAEAPILTDDLMDRLSEVWCFGKPGARTRRLVDDILGDMNILKTVEGSKIFCWKPGQAPSKCKTFRVFPYGVSRPILDIPIEELTAAVLYTAQRMDTCSKDKIEKETAKLFGAYLAGVELKKMEAAVRRAVKNGLKLE